MKHTILTVLIFVGILFSEKTFSQDQSTLRTNYKGETIINFYKSVKSLVDTDKITLDPNAVIGVLPNGFKYYTAKSSTVTNKIYIKLIIKAGYAVQDANQVHVAHLLEHAVFRGTKSFPGDSLLRYLKSKGIEKGIDNGASTGFTFVDYDLNIPSGDIELLENCLKTMRERAQGGLILDDEAINAERNIVKEEILVRSDPTQEIRNSLSTELIKGSCYWETMHLNAQEQVNGLLRTSNATVRQFYKDWYRPDLQGIVIVGNIDENAIEKRITELFSDMVKPENPRVKQECRMELGNKNRLVVKTQEPNEPIEFNIYFKNTGTGKRSYGDFKLAFIGHIYNEITKQRSEETDSPRTMQNFRFHHSYTDRLIPFLWEDIVGVNLSLQVPFDASSNSIEQYFNLAMTDLEQVRRYGFKQDEIDIAKQKLLKLYTSNFFNNTVSQVQGFRDHFVYGKAAPGYKYSAEMYQRILKELTVDEINEVVKQWLSGAHVDATILSPLSKKQNLPNENTLWTWISKIKNDRIQDYAYKPRKIVEFDSLYKLPKSTPFTKHYNKELDVTTLMLANGAKVIIKPTATEDRVYIQARSDGGASLYKDKAYFSALVSANLIENNGFGEFNGREFNRYLISNKINVYPSVSNREEGISASSDNSNFEMLLQVIYRCFTYPNHNTSLSTEWINKQRKTAAIERIVASDTILRIKNFGAPEWWLSKDEDWTVIDPLTSYRIYKEQFSNAGDFVFIVSGLTNLDIAIPLLVKYIGALPDHGKRDKLQMMEFPMPKGIYSEMTKSQKLAAYNDQINLYYFGTHPYSEKTSLTFQILSVLLNEVLNNRVREKEGGTYSLLTYYVNEKQSQSMSIFRQSILFNCSNNNRERLLAAISDEINKFKRDGVSKENFENAVAQVKAANDPAKMGAQSWRIYLNKQYQDKVDINEILHRQTTLQTIKQEDILDLAKKYLKDDYLYKQIVVSANNPTK